MKRNSTQPVYAQIALDIAARIAREDLKENTRISGRSLMSSEYGVSPETIRRSLGLLEETGIVEVRHNSGAVIKSKTQALAYLERYSGKNDVHQLKHELKQLMSERAKLDDDIVELVSQIADLNQKYSFSDPLMKFEIPIPPGSQIIGKTIAESEFWQNTQATIIALSRDGKTMLSPGPTAVFKLRDVVIVVGDIQLADKVKEFVRKKK
jgi:K+/H+ antiporter YhaU regulatory subunit KhtT